MALSKVAQISFAGGEISPDMYGRQDDTRYQNGLAVCRNFLCLPQGPIRNRPGFAFVCEAGDESRPVRLIPFTYSVGETMIIELGHKYARFHSDGATLVNDDDTYYQISTPWAAEDLFDLVYVQSGDIVTIVGDKYPPTEIRRYGARDWRIHTVAFNSTLQKPTGVTAVRATAAASDSNADKYTQRYRVSCLNADKTEESEASDVVSCVANLYAYGTTVKISCDTVPGAAFYRFYKNQGGLYGYIGDSEEPSIIDDNIAPKTDRTIRRFDAAFRVSDGITSVSISSQGSGYSTSPRVYVTDSAGYGAVLEASMENGRIVAINVVRSGRGYRNPTVVINHASGGGSGAAATASVGVTGDYPRAVGYFEQRRIFAGLQTDQQRVVMTRSGTESDLTYSLPYRSDDRISFQIASREFNQIQHVVSLANLLVLTSGMGFRISPQDGSVITPESITAKPQSNEGASRVMPQVLNNSVVYCAARGGHVRELGYTYNAGGYVSNDLCLRATHLFDFKTLKDSALSRAPVPILWFVSSDGSLLSQTYIPEQEVNAWSKNVTDGAFESVACVEEGDEDHLYAVVRRTINGQQRRFIERMESQKIDTLNDAFFVDCGAVYDGAPATTISGIDWLEGKTVSILADGAVMPQKVVKNGSITIDAPASHVVVGLPYQSDAQTLPAIIQTPSGGLGIMKNATKVSMRVFKSSGIFAGPSFDNMAEFKQRKTEVMGTPPALFSGELTMHIPTDWQDAGSICVRQSDPLPLTVQCAVLTLST